MMLLSEGKFGASFANMRLGWKFLDAANALAYNTTEVIAAVKSFAVQAPRVFVVLDGNL